MNEMGIIYHGAYDDIAERDWNYGQVAEETICHTYLPVRFSDICLFFLVQLWSLGCLSVHHGQV